MAKIATQPGIFDPETPNLAKIWTNCLKKDFSIKIIIISFFVFFCLILGQNGEKLDKNCLKGLTNENIKHLTLKYFCICPYLSQVWIIYVKYPRSSDYIVFFKLTLKASIC